jgi:DNA-binding NtrC family response regulator
MRPSTRTLVKRPMLYQLCRAGDRFEVGDGPVALSSRPVVIGRGDGSKGESPDGAILIDDPWLSSKHAQIVPLERRGTDVSIRARGGLEAMPNRFVVEDLGSTNGVLVNGAPAQRVPLLHGDLIETGRTFWVYLEEPAHDPLLAEPFELGPIVTWTPSYAVQLESLMKRAQSDAHVLLTGPEGSGKGFLARTLHQQSGRDGRFVHLDCRERKSKRLVVDLFGSDAQAGRLRDAESGTFFLENVDALPLEVQDRLLEALDRAAGGRTQAARVVAGMTQSVRDAIEKNHVREALIARLRTIHVDLPALPQRLADLGLLLDEFLARARGAPGISRDAVRVLMRTSFRFNVKALSRVVEAAASLAATASGGGRAGSIELVHLPVEVVGPSMLRALMTSMEGGAELTSEGQAATQTGAEVSAEGGFDDDDPAAMTDPVHQRRPDFSDGISETSASGLGPTSESPLDPDTLIAALRAAHGNVSAAARRIGRPRAFVQRLLREFGISPESFR